MSDDAAVESSDQRDGGSGALPVRVARSLWSRWRRLASPAREEMGSLADEVRDRALELRGSGDPEGDGRSLDAASERLAGAMVDAAEADPEVSPQDVDRLRNELSRELDRVARGEVTAYRGPARPVERSHDREEMV